MIRFVAGPGSFASFVLIGTLLFGCERGNDSSASNGPLGPKEESALLAPFAGTWVFDLEKTLASRKATGLSDEHAEQLRKSHQQFAQFGGLHSDMQIDGDVAVGDGVISSEYRFFAMHPHDGKVCGKAWHHEDRHDPGDMSKCYVRLWREGDDLHMDLRMKDGLPELDDPDLASSQPPEGGSAEACDAEHPAGPDWSEWETYVFVKKT